MAPDFPPGTLTYAEVAALIKERTGKDVDVGSLRGYRHSGHMPQGKQVGATRLFDRAEIEAWLAERPGQGARTDLRDTGPRAEPDA